MRWLQNMSSIDDVVYILVVFLICLLCFTFVRLCCVTVPKNFCPKRRRDRLRAHLRISNQQEDIFNISSRVQGQGQWPTHDAHVSLDHFTIANEINKYNDHPPTYEEAMNIAASNNNDAVVPAVAPKAATLPPPSTAVTTSSSTSTSTSTAN